MRTGSIRSLLETSDEFYDNKKKTRSCGKFNTIILKNEYESGNIALRLSIYPELQDIVDLLLKYVEEIEPVKQEEIKSKIKEVLNA